VRLVRIGLGHGTAGALLITRLMASLRVGTPTTDPFIFLGVGVLITGVTVLACYVPARQVGKVDPVRVIQAE
jgi:ABC-type antimicrobial peptide transport system permease subunit